MSEDKKTRFWVAILYPESLVYQPDEWADIIQKPFSYCLHDKDKTGHNGDRKAHYHVIICWNNNTTYKSAFSLFQELMPSLSKIEPVKDIKYMYNYLIHDTDSCRKAGKYLYDKSERIECNNFDIGLYETFSINEKNMIRKELARVLLDKGFCTFTDFYYYVLTEYEDSIYEEVVSNFNNFYTNLCKGIYLKRMNRN